MALESIYLNGGFIGVTKSFVTRVMPTVVGTATNILNNGVATHPVNLPAGNVDDLLIIFLTTDSSSTFTNPTGWTQLLKTTSNSTQPSTLISYRWATGSEGSTVNVAAGGAGGSPGGVNASIRIRNANVGSVPKIASLASSSTASPNPPSLTPNVGFGEMLWIAAGLWSGSSGNISSYPTNYNLGQTYVKNTRNASTSWGSLGISAKQLDALTEDPSTYTISAASIALAATISVESSATSTGIWNLQSVYENLYTPSNIVTNGLILALDAGDSASYPGSGTIWYDTSGNGFNGTLTNGATYSTSDGGVIVLDGTNDYVSIPHNTTLNPTQNMTLSGWVYFTQIRSMIFYGKSSTSSGSGGFDFKIDSATSLNLVKYFIIDQTITLPFTLTTNTWYNFTAVQGSTSVAYYVNGQLAGTYNNSTAYQTNTTTAKIGLARDSSAFPGRISNVLHYNRQLTASEVLQNYNALKGRFGL